MKPNPEYRVGIGASSILMILVVLALAALSLLSLGSAKNSAALSQRNLQMTLTYYQAAAEVQRDLSVMDSLIAEHAGQSLTSAEWGALFSAHGLQGLTIADNMTFSLSTYAGAQRLLLVEGSLTPAGVPRYTLTRHELSNQAPLEEPTLPVAMP